ncbi:hypothetical protein H4S02_012612 [Coemansia sp. RSA 2611]|nr:hypothetical protein H4S02_012612 [Coemansia sp. RSA 2611]
MSTVTETLVVSETETIEGDIESVFATVTVVTAAESSESSETETGAETEKSSLPPWLIGLIVLIVVAVLLLMVLFGYLYYRWRKRQREQYLASLVRPVSYPEEYLNPSGKEKDSKAYYIQNSYNHPEERQSRYNSKGSYVGYI